mmetsp:Transcript_31778/g.64679  ORF Transcript_31778/g.64679 Transcript_31778/m.64679 type:complete len:92 (+) Transcript_31778:292-567(+)
MGGRTGNNDVVHAFFSYSSVEGLSKFLVVCFSSDPLLIGAKHVAGDNSSTKNTPRIRRCIPPILEEVPEDKAAMVGAGAVQPSASLGRLDM